jgi:hypothetical protein
MVERSLLFFVGRCAELKHLIKKVSFSVIRTFYFQNPQKKSNAAYHFSLSEAVMMEKHLKNEHLYLINAGLDVAYMLGGAYLWQLSAKKPSKQALLSGYGQSVVLQAAFLLAFDTGMYFIQRNHRLSFASQFGYNGDFSYGLQYIF